MKKVFALLLSCAFCVGCQSGGPRWPGAAVTSTPPVPGAAANDVAAVAPAATNATAASATGTPATQVSTLGKIWNAIAFQQPAPTEPAPVSPEMARFNAFVSTIGTQSSQLSVNDPPEVTRQKAEALMTTLRDWDSVLAAGRSIGLVNDATANLLTSTVQRLTAETQKLVQYAPHPETINAVQQLGGSLVAAYANVQGIFARGASLSQALQGGGVQ